MTIYHLIRAALFALLIAAAPAALIAQELSAPRAVGLGGAYVAQARGYEALWANPANLGLPGGRSWSAGFAQLGGSAASEGVEPGDFLDLLRGGELPQAQREALLARTPPGGAALEIDARIPLASVQIGGFAAGIAYGAAAEQSLGRDLIDLWVNGYQQGRIDYSVGNTSGTRATYWDVAVGHGRRIGPLRVGVTGHLYRGVTLTRSRLFEPQIDLMAQSISAEYREVLARDGTGYGVDIGAAFEPAPGATVSAAVANAWSTVQWNDQLRTRGVALTEDEFGASERYLLDFWQDFLDSEIAVDASAPPSVALVADGLRDGADFPPTLRTGLGYRLPGAGTLVEVSYRKELSGGRLGAGWSEALSAGVQQKLLFLTLRAGAATDLEARSQLGGGLSLGPIHLGIARISDDGREGWTAAVGLGTSTR